MEYFWNTWAGRKIANFLNWFLDGGGIATWVGLPFLAVLTVLHPIRTFKFWRESRIDPYEGLRGPTGSINLSNPETNRQFWKIWHSRK